MTEVRTTNLFEIPGVKLALVIDAIGVVVGLGLILNGYIPYGVGVILLGSAPLAGTIIRHAMRQNGQGQGGNG